MSMRRATQGALQLPGGVRVACSSSNSVLVRSRSRRAGREIALHFLRMFQVALECRSGADQRLLQLSVLRAGDERLADGVDHGLVIADFVVNVGFVEGSAVEGLQRGEFF